MTLALKPLTIRRRTECTWRWAAGSTCWACDGSEVLPRGSEVAMLCGASSLPCPRGSRTRMDPRLEGLCRLGSQVVWGSVSGWVLPQDPCIADAHLASRPKHSDGMRPRVRACVCLCVCVKSTLSHRPSALIGNGPGGLQVLSPGVPQQWRLAKLPWCWPRFHPPVWLRFPQFHLYLFVCFRFVWFYHMCGFCPQGCSQDTEHPSAWRSLLLPF